MDKADFIRIAPEYYYAAVAIALQNTDNYFTIDTLKAFYTVKEDEGEIEYLGYDVLINGALAKMIAQGGVSETSDPFGPSLYQKTAMFNGAILEPLKTDASGPYYKNDSANKYGRWIRSALSKINVQYFHFGLSAKDFEREQLEEWAPIPVEPFNPALQKAVTALDDAIQQVEQNNGYAQQHPEERRYVLDGLKSLSHTLKTASSVSVQYVKRNGLEMLKKVRDRFTGSVIDDSAKAASAALLHWIKETAIELFNSLLGGPWW